MRDPRLDVLRALAILLVLGVHWPYTGPWQDMGVIGVDLFFVLSGYLISGLLFREHQVHGRISLLRFFVRRGLKIYPAFYVLILTTVSLWIVQRHHAPLTNLIAELFYFQNYHRGLWPHTWSLAAEEHFYLLLPLILVFLAALRSGKPDPFRWLPTLFVIVAVGCLALRLAAFPGDPQGLYLAHTHLRIDALFVGVLVRYVQDFRPATFASLQHPLLWVIGPALVLPVILSNPASWFVRTVGFTLNYLGFGCLLVAAMSTDPPSNRMLRRIISSFAALGVYSYSIYLWHVPLGVWLPRLFAGIEGDAQRPFGARHVASGFLLYLATSIAAGVLMAKIVEIPFLRLRDRFFPSRSSAPKPSRSDVPASSTYVAPA